MSLASVSRLHDRAEPVYLIKLSLGGSPELTLYLAERALSVGGIEYEDYIEGVDSVGETLGRRDSGGLNSPLIIRFINEPWGAYGRLVELSEDYPFEGALCELSEVYMDADGVPSEAELIFKGLLEGPHEADLMGFSCRVTSLMSRADMR